MTTIPPKKPEIDHNPDLIEVVDFAQQILGADYNTGGLWVFLPDFTGAPGTVTAKFALAAEIGPVLRRASELGMGSFLTLHPMQGGRRLAAHAYSARVFCIDGDAGEIPRSWPSQPNLIHTRGPGKWAAFWRIVKPPSDDNRMAGLRAWPWIQRALAVQFGGDRAVCDLARVMRVSGTNHWKAGMGAESPPPPRYTIIHSSEVNPLRWEEMAEALWLNPEEISRAGDVCPDWWIAACGAPGGAPGRPVGK